MFAWTKLANFCRKSKHKPAGALVFLFDIGGESCKLNAGRVAKKFMSSGQARQKHFTDMIELRTLKPVNSRLGHWKVRTGNFP
jgi:hypothetical protein